MRTRSIAPRRVFASYAAASVLLWLFFRNTEWQALVDSFRSVGWPLLAAAVLIRLASLIVSARRWQTLLEPSRHVPLRGVVAVTMMGMAAAARVRPAGDVRLRLRAARPRARRRHDSDAGRDWRVPCGLSGRARGLRPHRSRTHQPAGDRAPCRALRAGRARRRPVLSV